MLPKISLKHRQVMAEILMPFLILGIGILIYDNNYRRAQINYEKFCEAIRISEGIHSKFPYGIKSVRCQTEALCKEQCLKRIHKYWRDFKKNEHTGIKGFIRYASKCYVTDADRIGEKNWVNNVTKIYCRHLDCSISN